LLKKLCELLIPVEGIDFLSLHSFVMKNILWLLGLLVFSSSWAQTTYMLTGTYTKGKSKGIYVYSFNHHDGSAKLVDSISTPNPSYLAVSPDQRFVYAVSEVMRGNRSGKVRAFAFDKKNGSLRLLNEQSSVGDNPCYVTIDKTGKWVIVGNYTSGTLAVLPVKLDGSLSPAVSSAEHHGHGTNPGRQEAPHVHSVVLSPDNQFLFVPDLGIDKIMVYSFNNKTGVIAPAKDSVVRLQDGSGPRHFDFHPSGKWAYLVQELSGTVTAFQYNAGKLKPIQTITTLPSHYDQPFTSADIHVSPDGKFLYATNRDSSNTVAIFKINQQTGQLEPQGHHTTSGKTPRNFNFDPGGDFLLVANQNSDNIVIFRINHKTGGLTDTGNRIDVGNPVCIKWVR
jgi:6-phosphogluconolactonase